MSNTFKFRIKSHDRWGREVFIYWGVVDGKFIHPCISMTDFDKKIAKIEDWDDVEKSQRFLGFLDANGKEVYVGDKDKVYGEIYEENGSPFVILDNDERLYLSGIVKNIEVVSSL